MKVLGIGYGRHLFDQNNFEFYRLNRCAEEVESFDQIIFANKNAGLKTVTTENNFILHPTNSINKFLMIFDAVRIGSQLIEEKKIDVISTQDVFETGVVGVILKLKYPHVRLQVQEHGDVLSSVHWRREKMSNRFRYLFARFLLLPRADIIRVVSDRTQTFLYSFLGEQKNIKKLPVVIDTTEFVKELERVDRVPSENFVLLTAARYVPQKNFTLMLKAFARAQAQIPNLRLRIFGDGPENKNIKHLIHSLHLSDVVEMNDWTNNLVGEMQRADAYLLTSNYEGWARVLIESVLQELPVVTTDVGCVNEVIKDMEHGLVVPVGDCQKLTEAIQKIASDVSLYTTIVHYLKTVEKSKIPGTDVDAYAEQWVQTLR